MCGPHLWVGYRKGKFRTKHFPVWKYICFMCKKCSDKGKKTIEQMETKSISQATSSKFGPGVDFSALPEVCIAGILAWTSPRDACRMSVVSPEFLSAAESDALWQTFLPDDYQEMIGGSSESSARLDFSSKKELFFRLCNSPLLIDGGKKVNSQSAVYPFFFLYSAK